MTLDIKEYYKGKTIMITGCTGFIGKVILEKVIRTCTDVKKIYVMIRSKRGSTPLDRLNRDILSSVIFKELFENRPELVQMVRDKVVPVHGDLVSENLGMDPAVRAMLCAEIEVLISSAASVDFNESLVNMLPIDYLGPQRVMAFA